MGGEGGGGLFFVDIRVLKLGIRMVIEVVAGILL